MKKIISTALALVMLMSVATMPMSAYAASAPKATSISKVTAQSCAFKVTWKEVKKVTGYQVSYSTSKKFTKKTTKTVKVKKASSKSKTVKKLKAKKKYYVRVRTYKTSGKKTKYSKYSKVKTVTTKKKATTSNSSSSDNDKFTGNINPYTGKKIAYTKIPNAKGIVIAGGVWEANGLDPNESVSWDGYLGIGNPNTVGPVCCPSLFDSIYAIDMAKAAVNECHLTSDMTDLKKLVIISKWLSTNIKYNNDWSTNKNTAPHYAQTAYELFKYKTAVCAGYARALQMMCSVAGIECYDVLGQNQGGAHAWNLVKIEGYWYGINCYGMTHCPSSNGNIAMTKEEFDQFKIDYPVAAENARKNAANRLSVYGGCMGSKNATGDSCLFDSSQALWNSLQPKGTLDIRDKLATEFYNMFVEIDNWQIG